MIRPLEAFIGLRYTRAKRRNHFISFITLISVLGITIGVWALITVLSIMNGFERELRDRILGVASHVTVSGPGGWLDDWEGVAETVARHPGVVASAPYILGQGMLTNGRAVQGALVRGVMPVLEADVSEIEGNTVQGSLAALAPGEYSIVLGSTLALQLGVGTGDKVTLVAPSGQMTPAGLLPRLRRFTVVGTFEMGMYEYDAGLALVHIDDAARLYRADDQVSGLRLRLDDVFEARQVSRELRSVLGTVAVTDWTDQHRNFFRALKIEKRVMFIILFLIVAVAAFNIVSTLVMVVSDKQADIAILRTLGLSPGSVMGVFMVQGTVIGLVGIVVGGLTGVLTAVNVETLVPWLESLFGVQFFPADVYVISDFPAELHWDDVVRVLGAAFGMSLVATVYPSWRAARTQPAEALRYE